MFLPIETSRLLIRVYQDSDLEDILEYSNSTDFWLIRSLEWKPTEEGTRKFWNPRQIIDQNRLEKRYDLVIERKENKKVIGNIGITLSDTSDNQHGMIHWLVGSSFQGKGFASEAAKAFLTFGFDKLKLHRISASTSRDNIRSWLLMERIGMRREAHFKKNEFVNGEWQDTFIYAILAEEWLSRQ